MGKFGAGLAALGAFVLLGVSSAAYASTTSQSTLPPKLSDFAQVDSTNPSAPIVAPTPHKTYQFDTKQGWGVKLDLSEPTNRGVDWKDVQAGAYFRLSPSIRVGGSVGLGDKFAQPQHLTPEDTAPRVHLETAFKF